MQVRNFMGSLKKQHLFIIAIALALLLQAAGCGQDKEQIKDNPLAADRIERTEEMQNLTADGYLKADEKTLFVDILMDSGSHIVIELDQAEAPLTVANFQKLVEQSFYDGIVFHRIIKDFMIQGGDPDGTGRGGAKEQIKGEFLSNGVANKISHLPGVVSMARTQIKDSASSQFFICHGDCRFLDGDYAAFGKVVYGMDEVDRLAAIATDRNDYPQIVPVMEKVFFVRPE